MKKFIVLTTIYKPMEATLKFLAMSDWKVIIVGDLKTPHEEYLQLERNTKHCNLQYLTPQYQSAMYPQLSEAIGWNASGRRSIGFIEAYRQGCDLLAHVDDDNIPYDNWGKDIIVNKETEMDLYETENIVFEPLSVTNVNHVWHRGYPIDLVKNRFKNKLVGKVKVKVLVQENFWNGYPDIDAFQRILFDNCDNVVFDVKNYFTSTAPFNPFNTQNTFMSREVIPYFMLLTHVGNVDDILGSYLAQKYLYKSKPIVAYGPPTVFQKRHEHNFFNDLEKEIYGFKNASALLRSILPTSSGSPKLPEKTLKCFELYRSYFE